MEVFKVKIKSLVSIVLSALFIIGCADASKEADMNNENQESLFKDFWSYMGLMTDETGKDKQISVQMERIPFEENVLLKENEGICIYDLWGDRILYSVFHWDDSSLYYYTDQICVWNMETEKLEYEIRMNQEHILSASLGENGIYVSGIWLQQNEEGFWNWETLFWDGTEWKSVIKGKGKGISLEAPKLIRCGEDILAVYESWEHDSAYEFGTALLTEDNAKFLENEKSDKKEEADIHLLDADLRFGSSQCIAYFIEREHKGYFRIVDKSGAVKEVPAHGKLYRYSLTNDYFIQSGVLENEQRAEKYISIYNLQKEYSNIIYSSFEHYRQCTGSKNNMFSVNMNFDVFYTVFMGDKFVEYKLEASSLEYKQAAVDFIYNGESFYFLYFLEFNPDKVQIFKAKIM